MSLSKALSRIVAKSTHTGWGTLFLHDTTRTKSAERVEAYVVPAAPLRSTDAVLRPCDLCRYCQSDLELSDTSFPRANTDSQPHNLSAHPSTQHPCHPAPSKTLTKEFFFFLIRTIFPVSNTPSPPQHSTPLFPPACLPHHILQTWTDWNAGRVEEVGRRWVGACGGGKRGLLRAHDAGRCYSECEDRGQRDWDRRYSITTRPLQINPPAFVIISPFFLFLPSLSLCVHRSLGAKS